MNKKKEPKFLYKIFNQKYFLKFIGSKSLYLSNPADFNDPYDCALGIDIEKLSEQEKKTVIKKHFQEKGIDLTEVQVRDKVKENEKKGWTIINEAARETSLELAKVF